MVTVIIFTKNSGFTIRKPSSHTRRCCIRVSPLCNIPTAASRRSLGRVSSPNVAVQPLSPATDRRLGRPFTPPTQLIGRESIFQRIAPLVLLPCGNCTLCGISVLFKTLFPSERQVTHALLTRPPLGSGKQAFQTLVSTCMC